MTITTKHSIEINAPRETVFNWVTDRSKVVRWAPNLLHSEITRKTTDRVGTTFRQVYEQKGRSFEFRVVVTVFEPDRRLVTHLFGKRFDAISDYQFERLGDGTRLTLLAEVRFQGLMKLAAMFQGHSMQQAALTQTKQEFRRLKRLCESAVATTSHCDSTASGG